MKTFYFDTGVKFSSYPFLCGNQVNRGGNKQIPYDVADDVPNNAELIFICDTPDLPEAKAEYVIVRPIFNSDIISKYAYFKIKNQEALK